MLAVCLPGWYQVQIDSSGDINIKQPIWISRMTSSQLAGGWQLTGNNKGQGTYGAVVIAHNGKCANRLVVMLCQCKVNCHDKVQTLDWTVPCEHRHAISCSLCTIWLPVLQHMVSGEYQLQL